MIEAQARVSPDFEFFESDVTDNIRTCIATSGPSLTRQNFRIRDFPLILPATIAKSTEISNVLIAERYFFCIA